MSTVSTMMQYSTKEQDLYENQTSQQNAFIDNITDGQWSTTIQYSNTKLGNIINLFIDIIFIITGVLFLNNYNVLKFPT